MSEQTITVWKDGTWKTWTARDAHYAANDEDWLVNIPIKEIDYCQFCQRQAAKGHSIWCPNYVYEARKRGLLARWFG